MLLVLLSCVLAAGSAAPQAKAVGVRYSDGVDGEEYLVEELRVFGVEPVTVFLTDVPPPGHFRQPEVETTSADLVAAVDIAPGDVPHFQVSLTNKSTSPLLAFYVQSSQGDRPPATRRPRNLDGAPLAQPGETYVLDVRASIHAGQDGRPQWAVPDRIRISQLSWRGGPATVSAAARAAIHAPSVRLGRTYESFAKVLPPPVRRFTVGPFPNPHAEVLQARWTVDYGGIEVTFFGSPSSTSILVTAVTVTDLKWLKVLGVDIDSSTMRYGDEEGSDIGPSTLTLHFDRDRLVRASWAFPWD